jgi:hypothetical protein
MYIDLVRRVLEQAVDAYATAAGKPVSDVLAEIRTHIDETAKEHRKDEPEINYENPLCRLGYLYRHATANATLFELVLKDSGELRSLVRNSANKRINLCAIGGGPGTELLGLAKFMIRRRTDFPKKITFTVLDAVPQWAETWQQLADAVEAELQRTAEENGATSSPVIAPVFLPLDVLDAESYRSYAYQFSGTQAMIFNYLFSERKTRLADAESAVAALHSMAPPGCIFVVIDRLEHDNAFSNSVRDMFQKRFSKPIQLHTFGGCLDSDEQSVDMGKLLNKALGNPRVKFFTDLYRSPTVFWFASVKE